MKKAILVVSVLALSLFGTSNVAGAYAIDFGVQSVNNGADTASLIISDPIQSLAAEGDLYGGMVYAPATFSATGAWAAYAPEVAIAGGMVGFQKTGDSWTTLFLQVYAYNSASSAVMSASLIDLGLFVTLPVGGTSTNLLISPDPTTNGQYRLFEMASDGTQTDLNTPLLLTLSVNPSAVPLPASILFLAPGLFGLGVMRRVRKKV